MKDLVELYMSPNRKSLTVNNESSLADFLQALQTTLHSNDSAEVFLIATRNPVILRLNGSETPCGSEHVN